MAQDWGQDMNLGAPPRSHVPGSYEDLGMSHHLLRRDLGKNTAGRPHSVNQYSIIQINGANV